MKTFYILLMIIFMPGCAYMANRGQDAKDIVTLGIGIGAGATARVGPIGTGMGFYEGRAGLVGGECYNNYGKNRKTEYYVDDGIIHCVILGVDGQGAYRDGLMSKRNKEYDNTFVGPVAVQGVFMKDGKAKSSAAYYTEIEATAAIGGGIKIGFNPGELLDFFLGWFGIDIYSDDK